MCIFCGIVLPSPPFCPWWICSFFLFFPNCCAWCSIFLGFVLAVFLLNALKLTTILEIQPFASSIFPFFFYFVPFFFCSMFVFSSIFLPITFCCPLATDCIHSRQNYAPFFCGWDCFLTWLMGLLAIFFFFFFFFFFYTFFFFFR